MCEYSNPNAQAQLAKDLKFNRAKAGGLQWATVVDLDPSKPRKF